MPPVPLTLAQLYVYPMLAVLVLWSLLTVGLLWLNRRGPRPGRIALVILTSVLVFAHHELWTVRDDLSLWGCYRAFAAGMLIWAWHELAFYSGVLTGPWRAPCPPDVRGWRRFHFALSTHVYHELAVGVEVVALWWIHRDASNVFDPLTFVLLWALLHSAKLNVFLGVRSLTVDWLPAHMRYLGSFWRRRHSNPLFLSSVLAISLLAVWLWVCASTLNPYDSAIGFSLLAVMATLGALEHWMLMLPLKRPATATPRPASAIGQHLSE